VAKIASGAACHLRQFGSRKDASDRSNPEGTQYISPPIRTGTAINGAVALSERDGEDGENQGDCRYSSIWRPPQLRKLLSSKEGFLQVACNE
jgi:hypothetical protein